MKVALDGVPEDTRQQPSDVVTMKIDPRTGEAASPDQQNALFEYFLADHTPTARASSQTDTDIDLEAARADRSTSSDAAQRRCGY